MVKDMVQAKSDPIRSVYTPSLQSVHDRMNASIFMESDCSLVVDGLQRRNQGMSRLWNLFEEFKQLQDSSSYCVVEKIGRERDKAAHALADVARISGNNYFSFGHVHPEVVHIVESGAVICADHI